MCNPLAVSYIVDDENVLIRSNHHHNNSRKHQEKMNKDDNKYVVPVRIMHMHIYMYGVWRVVENSSKPSQEVMSCPRPISSSGLSPSC